jgi:threonine dehydrogenase-like Zn-dependent dehydrogenase
MNTPCYALLQVNSSIAGARLSAGPSVKLSYFYAGIRLYRSTHPQGNFLAMKITIFGTGYVGLVTGACLADSGLPVMCTDVNTNKIAAVRAAVMASEASSVQQRSSSG